MFFRTEDNKGKPYWKYEYLAVPIAFLNGLYLGGCLLRKMRQTWEHGPRD
ncbi:MAG TPA: hypothetical protein GXX39_08105 [Syntrophothermus lipocalidus]|uniref:Uncharacterized protein n=1 Tax=Syntrophothermus lipocalidus (strain DSM 12680 / TGB-C1) TaxID=643648 RepID=D7CJ32_SYNLT|nr:MULTISPECIES: hypothetical protein [Syntrophothermus]ADI02910.1 hypothetical protein Slip_2168 [Syntrophothermus lipocalidus DSM 12680]NSW82627.1 hypothetical protein [Syntrophothermus sp.]HHV77315.1 hypothetical protein [Syntrophothermus lipocalidus]HOV42639.1 hypothetical protein [Syntrophothermus lipocalidus]